MLTRFTNMHLSKRLCLSGSLSGARQCCRKNIGEPRVVAHGAVRRSQPVAGGTVRGHDTQDGADTYIPYCQKLSMQSSCLSISQ
jgi:hypothetical protein